MREMRNREKQVSSSPTTAGLYEKGGKCLWIVIEVAGARCRRTRVCYRKEIHSDINEAQSVWHMGHVTLTGSDKQTS